MNYDINVIVRRWNKGGNGVGYTFYYRIIINIRNGIPSVQTGNLSYFNNATEPPKEASDSVIQIKEVNITPI